MLYIIYSVEHILYIVLLPRPQSKAKKQNVCVLTHHTPTLVNTSHPDYTNSATSSAFSSSLGRFTQVVRVVGVI